MKAEGKLHPDATFADLQTYLDETLVSQSSSKEMSSSKFVSQPTGKRKRLDDDIDESNAETLEDEAAELARRKEELLARLNLNTPNVEVTEAKSPAQEIVERMSEVPSGTASPTITADSATRKDSETAATPAKRLRPDVSAIGRILQRQAVVSKPRSDGHMCKLTRPQNIERKSKKAPVVEEPPEPEGASDPDFWKTRINLSAFESWDEEHELSTPPFPFEQHWDPASKLMRENQQKERKKKKKARQSQEQEQWPLDNVDQEPEETPMLDYDDSPETLKASSEPTDAIESQIMQDVQLAIKDDLPALPDDISVLPALQPSHIQVGAVVVFKIWTIDPVTVTPNISGYKTAIVDKEGDSGNGAGTFRLKLATRDIPNRTETKLDDQGKPIKSTFSGFSMADEEDEDDDGIWEGMFAELVEPKLLKAAE